MKLRVGMLVAFLALAGCRTAHDVAVSSYRVATAPVNLVRHSPSNTTTTVTTTTTTAAPQAPSSTQTVAAADTAAPRARSRSVETTNAGKPATTESKPKAASSQRTASQLQFPTAKPVPGKPGYVYSPSDPGKYVDVSGYAPGSKVKDPYSGKIFLVP